MRYPYVLAPVLFSVFAAGLATSAQAYDQRDAIRDCERHLQRSYHYRPDQVHNVAVRRQGPGAFEIHGRLRLENLSDPDFTCIVHHREVVSLRVNNAKATAEAIGKGVLGAVLGGIVGSLAEAARDAGDPHQAYARPDDPFRDETFLRDACKHELRRHLRVGHGPVDIIRITNAHLHGRSLDGDGVVAWRDGARQRIHFTCEFDRSGRIHDGRYSYYGAAADVGQLPADRPDPGTDQGGGDRYAQVRSDCIRAVRRLVGGARTSVMRVEPGENFFTVRLNVEGAQAPWICEHSSRDVMRVYYGAEG